MPLALCLWDTNTSADICQGALAGVVGHREPNPKWSQNSPSPAGRGVGWVTLCSHRAIPAPMSQHLPEAGFPLGHPEPCQARVTPGWRLQSQQAAALSVTHSAQPCCPAGAARERKGGALPGPCPAQGLLGLCCRALGCGTKPSARPLVVLDTDSFLTAPP